MTAIQMAPLLQNPSSSAPTVPPPPPPQLSEKSRVARVMTAIQLPPLLQNPNLSIPTVPPPPPPLIQKNRVQRNLFGSPKPGEIALMLEEEEQSKIEHIEKKYNIINLKKKLEKLDKCNNNTALVTRVNSISAPLLEHKSNCVVVNNTVSSSLADDRLTHLDREKRSKPYGRQSSIKDYNRVRKSTQRRQEITPPNVPRCITSVAKPQTSTTATTSVALTTTATSVAAPDNSTNKSSCSAAAQQPPLPEDNKTQLTAAVAVATKLAEQA